MHAGSWRQKEVIRLHEARNVRADHARHNPYIYGAESVSDVDFAGWEVNSQHFGAGALIAALGMGIEQNQISVRILQLRLEPSDGLAAESEIGEGDLGLYSQALPVVPAAIDLSG